MLRPVAVYTSTVGVLIERARDLILLGLLVFIPLALLDTLFEGIGTVTSSHNLLLIAAVTTFAGLQVLITLLGEVFYSGAVAGMIGPRAEHGLKPLEVMRRIPFGRLVVADIIFAVGVVLGFVLLIVPGIILFTWYGLVAPVIEIEERGVRDGFRRSREVVRGSFWRVLAVLGPVTVLNDAVTAGITSEVEDLVGHSFFATWAGDAVGNLLASPLYAVPAVLMTVQLIEIEGSSAGK